jgi:hypothetical protein
VLFRFEQAKRFTRLVFTDTLKLELGRSILSADFISIFAVISDEYGRKFESKLSPLQRLGDLVGAEEETLFSFKNWKDTPDLKMLASRYRGRAPSVDSINGAYTEVDLEDVEQIQTNSVLAVEVTSTPVASFVAIDRAAAIPRGLGLLEGRAVRFFSETEIKLLQGTWKRLLISTGGSNKLVDLVAPYLDGHGNGRQDAADTVLAFNEMIERSLNASEGLLIVSSPVP